MLSYPPAPSENATEWPGTPIGLCNTITREKSALESAPTVREDFELLRQNSVRQLTGPHAFVHDSVFAGLRVRLFTNSPHLAAFWRETTWPVEEWRHRTGTTPTNSPDLVVDAIVGRSGVTRSAALRPDRREVLLLNDSLYSDVRRRVFSLITPMLMERGVLVVRAAAITCNGRACLLIGPTAARKTTTALQFARDGRGILSDQFVAVRFGRRLQDGRPVVYSKLDDPEGGEAIRAFTLQGHPVTVTRNAFGPAGETLAFAQPLERRIYIPTALVRRDPRLFPVLLRARHENVPDAATPLREALGPEIPRILQAAGPVGPGFLGKIRPGQAEEAVQRFLSSALGRSVVDPFARFGESGGAMARPGPVPVGGIVYLNPRGDMPSGPLDAITLFRSLAGATTADGTPELFCNPFRLEDPGNYGRDVGTEEEALFLEHLVDRAPVPLRTEVSAFARLVRSVPSYVVDTAGESEEIAEEMQSALRHLGAAE